MKKSDIDPPLESPIEFRSDAGSNGEVIPQPRTERDRKAEELYWRVVESRSKKLGVSRREFVNSACGTAAALAIINFVYGCDDANMQADAGARRDAGHRMDADRLEAGLPDRGTPDTGTPDSGYAIDAEETIDAGMACDALDGNEFIFDVQTHHANPDGPWRMNNSEWESFFPRLPQAQCGDGPYECFRTQHYLREVFLNSDTTMAVLSAVPAAPEHNPLLAEDAAETAQIMNMLADSERLIIHGMVLPNLPGQLEDMQRLAEDVGVSAWKIFTLYGNWRLDDPSIGLPLIERAREVGVKRLCFHKGLPLANTDPQYSDPSDIGGPAAMYPDVDFIIYHSGFESGFVEGPYDPDGGGIDRLIRTMLENGIGPNQNVYAELGTTWLSVMTRPTQAAHVLGKLLRYVGEDNILWGTDSIWQGSPQNQIEAFRTYQISEKLRARYGYPELSDRLKRKIFGLNAARVYGVDPDAKRCAIDGDELDKATASVGGRWPTYRKYGPQTRREFFAFLKYRQGLPG